MISTGLAKYPKKGCANIQVCKYQNNTEAYIRPDGLRNHAYEEIPLDTFLFTVLGGHTWHSQKQNIQGVPPLKIRIKLSNINVLYIG